MKRFIACSLLFLCAQAGFSQSGVRFGPKAGLNLATLSGSTITSPQNLANAHFGFVTHFDFSQTFALQPELFFSFDGTSTAEQGDYKFSYLRLPILFQLHAHTASKQQNTTRAARSIISCPVTPSIRIHRLLAYRSGSPFPQAGI